jgi:hypothetical protein
LEKKDYRWEIGLANGLEVTLLLLPQNPASSSAIDSRGKNIKMIIAGDLNKSKQSIQRHELSILTSL